MMDGAGDDHTGANVSLDAIKNAPTPTPPAGNGKARSEQDSLAHEQETFRNELGWLGRPFGGRSEKPGNISGLVIVACFALIIAAYIWPPGKDFGMSFEQIFAGLISVITLILGYLFGSNDRS